MSDFNTSTSTLELDKEGAAKLPSGLNVLTILTFVGCGVLLIWTLCWPMFNKFMLNFMDKAKSSGTELSAKQLEDMQKSIAVIEITQANIVPLTILSLVGVALCLMGAIWMRKLKKDGYWIYVAGQVVPIIAGFLIMGTYQFSDWKSYVGLAITALFILMYTTQRKYLTK